MSIESLNFRTASRCESNGCVGVAETNDGLVLMRDTKEADGPILRFSEDGWRSFITGLRAGDFEID